MKHITKTKVLTFRGENWHVDTRKSGIYPDMLRKMLNQLFIMLDHHSKVIVIRIDLHQPTNTDTNKRMTQFMRRLKKWLLSKYGLKRVGYIWAREQSKGKRQHYHWVLILDGHKINYPHNVVGKMADIWCRMGGGNYKPCNCFYNIKRGVREQLEKAIYRISYLAKVRSKGNRLPQTKDYSTSRLVEKYSNSYS